MVLPWNNPAGVMEGYQLADDQQDTAILQNDNEIELLDPQIYLSDDFLATPIGFDDEIVPDQQQYLAPHPGNVDVTNGPDSPTWSVIPDYGHEIGPTAPLDQTAYPGDMTGANGPDVLDPGFTQDFGTGIWQTQHQQGPYLLDLAFDEGPPVQHVDPTWLARGSGMQPMQQQDQLPNPQGMAFDAGPDVQYDGIDQNAALGMLQLDIPPPPFPEVGLPAAADANDQYGGINQNSGNGMIQPYEPNQLGQLARLQGLVAACALLGPQHRFTNPDHAAEIEHLRLEERQIQDAQDEIKRLRKQLPAERYGQLSDEARKLYKGANQRTNRLKRKMEGMGWEV